MSCDHNDHLYEILTDFDDLIAAVRCVYTEGAGLGLGVLGMFFFGFIGMALTIRTQHPAPILVSGILSSGVVVSTLPGIAAKVMALVLFFGLSGMGLYLYQRSQRAL